MLWLPWPSGLVWLGLGAQYFLVGGLLLVRVHTPHHSLFLLICTAGFLSSVASFFFWGTFILTLALPTIHTYYTTYFSIEIYQSESGWQKESCKSFLCTPGSVTVSNLILFCVLIWLKKWPLGKFGTFDTWVLANYEDNIITSPNCNFIPEPFCFKDDHIVPLHDGRFGLIDCFQWPQLHAEQYIWSMCIPRQAAYRDDPIWSILWWNMSQSPDKFVLEQGSAFKVGQVHKLKFQQLEKVHRCLDEHAQKWLKENPEYKGPLKLQEWVQCCSRALICLEVRNYVLCLWNTWSVSNRWSRVWGSGGYWRQREIHYSRQFNVKFHPFIWVFRNIVQTLTRCNNNDNILLVARLHAAKVTLVQCRPFDFNPALAWKCFASFECCKQSALFQWQVDYRFVGVEVQRGEILLDFEGTRSFDIQSARKPG